MWSSWARTHVVRTWQIAPENAGLTTVIVESELVGGECSLWACEPSKALLRPVMARATRAG